MSSLDKFYRNWAIFWIMFIIVSITATVLLVKVGGDQWEDSQRRCAERGGVLIDQYTCIDKDAVR